MPATYTCTNDQSKKFTQLCCDAIMVIYTCRHYTFTGIKISPAWNMATDSNWLPNLRASVSTFCAVMPDNQQWVAYAPFAEANGSKSPDIYNLIISRTWNVNITLIWYNILLAYHHRDGWSRRCTISDPWPKHCAPPPPATLTNYIHIIEPQNGIWHQWSWLFKLHMARSQSQPHVRYLCLDSRHAFMHDWGQSQQRSYM